MPEWMRALEELRCEHALGTERSRNGALAMPERETADLYEADHMCKHHLRRMTIKGAPRAAAPFLRACDAATTLDREPTEPA
jgi:hypothetical protein